MLNLSTLRGKVGAINTAARAVSMWAMMSRRPSTMTFTRPKVVHKDGTVTPPVTISQIVRVEYDNRPTIAQGVAGVAPILQAVIYGVVGHPDESIADTDIDEGYEFDWDGNHFRITDVIPVPGGVQAIAKVNS